MASWSHTCLSSSIVWYWPKSSGVCFAAAKVTVGLASHQLCITDLVVYPPTGSSANVWKMSTLPIVLKSSWCNIFTLVVVFLVVVVVVVVVLIAVLLLVVVNCSVMAMCLCDIQSHCAAIFLVRKLDSNILLQQLKRSCIRKPEVTKAMGELHI